MQAHRQRIHGGDRRQAPCRAPGAIWLRHHAEAAEPRRSGPGARRGGALAGGSNGAHQSGSPSRRQNLARVLGLAVRRGDNVAEGVVRPGFGRSPDVAPADEVGQAVAQASVDLARRRKALFPIALAEASHPRSGQFADVLSVLTVAGICGHWRFSLDRRPRKPPELARNKSGLGVGRHRVMRPKRHGATIRLAVPRYFFCLKPFCRRTA